MDNPGVQSTGSIGIQPLQGGETPKSGDVEKGKARMGVDREVTVTTPNATVQTPETEETTEPKDTSLSERKTENVTDEKPGFFGRLKSKAKEKGAQLKDYAAGKLESGKELGKKAVRGGVGFAHHPMRSTGEAMLSGAAYAQEKYEGAKDKGGAALTKMREGLSTFKADPKGVLSAGKSGLASKARSLKERAVSLPSTIKTKMPSRPKMGSLPNIKSIFSRSAKSVPPSQSVQQGISTVGKMSERMSTKMENTETRLETAKSEKANLKMLDKLMTDPSAFYKTDKEVMVSWGEQSVTIKGTGAERAKGVRDAVDIVFENRGEILDRLDAIDGEVSTLKSDKKKLKSKSKKQMQGARETLSTNAKESYKHDLGVLKGQRTTLKEKLSQAKAALKEALKGDKSEATELKQPLKVKIKTDTRLAKELSAELKTLKKQEKESLRGLESELKESQALMKKYQAKMDKAEGVKYTSAAAGFEAASQKVQSLNDEIAHQREGSELRIAQKLSTITDLKDGITRNKETLSDIGSSKGGHEDLRKQLEQAEQALERNTAAIKELQQQQRVDQNAIKKIK
ncbi:hypothetical protein [Parendozoicomonas haliclonae]|uniref:Uncharacterized protein n=1 Tax=Parendozoicomonas haliclonae TaxID=1960125 RepID=A0A1X7AF18_9GAMM|nr:hypothetical protein [Parendozoicomonas haliclonae]SMA34538.1 hypothetical protein EHSB41UT_00415 [Parendozoicomonas haliclonae]